MRNVVVTGVSSGIGAAIATVLADAGWRVFGSVRNEADARQARERFGDRFEPLLMDLTDEPSVVAAATVVAARLDGDVLNGLVNSAGIARAAPLLAQSTEDFREQVEIGLIGPFIVVKAFAPLLGAHASPPEKPGRIVNISSTSGRLGLPFLGAYAAVKHGLEGMSDSLRRELQLFGIEVMVVGPGAVATAIWDKAEQTSDSYLAATVWAAPLEHFKRFAIGLGRSGDPAERVGRVVLKALTAKRPKLRYAPVREKFLRWDVPTHLPARVLDRLIGKQFGLLRD